MTYYLLGIRILTEGYYIFRVYKLLNHAKNLDNFNYDNLIIISVMFNVFILVTIIFSTYKCVQNYGEGFKEMLNKQRNQGINSTDFNMSITPNFNQF